MRAPTPSSGGGSGGGAGRSKPQDQINSVLTEWKYPPQMIMMAKDPGTVAMLTGLGVGKIKSHAKKVFFHVLEDYREQGASAILRMYEVMSHFHFYNHKQQDLWIAHFFLELNLYLDYLYQQREEMDPGADYQAVKFSIPPLMLHTNMGLATAVSYAARQPHGLKIMEFLIEDQNIFNDILGAAEDSDRYRIQNLRSGVNYGMATQLYPKEQISQETEMARSSGRAMVGGKGTTTIVPISVQSPLWVSAVRANILVVKWLLERLGVTGGEPSLFDLTPLEAANIAKTLHASPDIINKDSNYYDNLVTIIPMLSRAAKTPKPKSSMGGGGGGSIGGRRPHPAAMGGGAAEFGAGITGVNYPNPYYRDPRGGGGGGGSGSSGGGGVTGIGDRGGGGYPGYQDDEPEDDGITTVSYATSADYYDSMRTAGGGGGGGSSSSRSSTSYLSGGGVAARHRHPDSSLSSGRTSHSSGSSSSGRPSSSSSKPSGSISSSKKPSSRGPGGGGGGNPDYFPQEFYGQ